MKRKKLNLDLEIRKLTKAIAKGSYMECRRGSGSPCRCGQGPGNSWSG